MDDPGSIEVVIHLVQCPACRDRVAEWNEKPRLEQLLHAFANGSGQGGGIHGSTPVEPDAETNVYATKPVRRVGQYELLRSIGKGGGGEVFEALHNRLRRRVAIKLLSKKDAGDESARRRFFREMESIGQLNHPHIVHAYDAGEADGVLYLAMELVEGENVETLARRVGLLPVAEACEIVRQAALGLQHVHDSELVHRDLKPSNLLMSQSGVKIADLGLALLYRASESNDRLTGHHTIVGTADYMAPEQAEGSRNVDIRADIYSLGCTLFRLLAGEPPFTNPENTTPMKKMWAHVSNPVPDISQRRPDVPAELSLILQKLMAKDRADRYAEPREVAEALAPYCRTSDVPSLVVTGPMVSNSTGRNSTQRDSANPLTSPSNGTRPTEIQTVSVQLLRPGIGTFIVIAILLGLAGWLADMLPQKRAIDAEQPAQKLAEQSQQRASVAPVQSAPQVEPLVEKPQAALLPQPGPAADGPIARRWLKEFEVLPRELDWGRPMDIGSARIDEGVGSLVVQARHSIRLVQLGEIREDEPGLNLQFRVNSQTRGGEYGVFLGFQRDQSDIPEFIEFQMISVVHLKATEKGDEYIVRRSHERFDIRTGRSDSTRNRFVKMQVPNGTDSLVIHLRTEGAFLAEVRVGDEDCGGICTSDQNFFYKQADYTGPFGFFVKDASVWFNNPHLKRTRE